MFSYLKKNVKNTAFLPCRIIVSSGTVFPVSVFSNLAKRSSRHPGTARNALLAGTMLLSGGLFLLSSVAMPSSALARCVNTSTGIEVTAGTGQPTANQSVTCDTTAPDPASVPINITAGNTGIIINIASGATLATVGAVAINVADNASTTITNNGTIDVTGTSSVINISRVSPGSSLVNNGIIRSSGGTALSFGQGNIYNSATGQIIGTTAIAPPIGGTVINEGLIQGTTSRAILSPIGANFNLVNTGNGIIQGVAVATGGLAPSVVRMSTGTDSFTSAGNSQIIISNGLAGGGIDGGAGIDTFIFDRASATTITHGIYNFETLRQIGADVLLDTDVALNTGGAGASIEAGKLGIATGRTLTTATIAMRDGSTLEVLGTVQGTTGGGLATLSGSNGSETLIVNGTLRVTANLQGGNDTLILRDSASLAGGGTINGGAGTNTVIADISGDVTPGFMGSVTNFQNLVKQGTGTFNLGVAAYNNIDVQTGTLALAGGSSSSVTNVASGAALSVSGSFLGTAGNDSFTSAGTVTASLIDLGAGDNTFIITDGTVAGNLQGGAGNDTFTLSGGRVNGTVNLGDGANSFTITGGSVSGLMQGGAGNDTLNWIGGGTLESGFQLGAGNDTALLQGLTNANLSQSVTYDGGLGTDRLLLDNVIANGVTAYKNWEDVSLVNGTQLTFASTLTLGDSGTGTGALSVDAASTIFAGEGQHSVAPFTSGQQVTLTNAGLIDLTNGAGAPTDSLTIVGNYTGQNGKLRLNTVLAGDGAASDRLIVDGGNASGTTTISIVNAGGAGAPTTNGILVVSAINGATTGAGAFRLAGDYVTTTGQQAIVAGAYGYVLRQNGITTPGDGNWYLRSELQNSIGAGTPNPGTPLNPGGRPSGPVMPLYQPGTPIYEAYPHNLMALNSMPTMQQRIGNRYWGDAVSTQTQQNTVCKNIATNFRCPVGATATGPVMESNALWTRAEISRSHSDPVLSTTGSVSDSDLWKLQSGVDGLLAQYKDGSRLMGGLTAHYGQVSSDINSIYGRGAIDTFGYGFGGTLTWFNPNGFYVDGQASASWFDSDLKSVTASRNLAQGNNGFGYAFSVEAGKKISINEQWTLTPQAQLTYANVRFDQFVDPFGANVSLRNSDNLRGRLGLSADWQNSWKDARGQTQLLHLYGIANIYYNFRGSSKVNVAGAYFNERLGKLWGGLGVGGSYNWNNDRFSVYGEISAQTAFKSFGNSYDLNGTLGMRIKW